VSQVIHVAHILQGLPKMLTNEYHNQTGDNMDAHKWAKREAKKNIKLQEVRKHYNLPDDVGKASKKKSQARPVVCVRIFSEHKRNPEEAFSFNHDN
jgi:hypothetical protein